MKVHDCSEWRATVATGGGPERSLDQKSCDFRCPHDFAPAWQALRLLAHTTQATTLRNTPLAAPPQIGINFAVSNTAEPLAGAFCAVTSSNLAGERPPLRPFYAA